MNFDISKYYLVSFDTRSTDLNRKRGRGFSQISCLFLENYYITSRGDKALVEIGIGGGGPHIQYRSMLQENIPVIGIDKISPNHFWTPKEEANYNHAMGQVKQGINFYWDLDAYDHSTAKTLAEKWNKFGIVIDDGSPTYGSLYGINGWKPFLDDNGVIISEHPFGNGTALPWSIYQDKKECQYALEYSSELNEMVIFDCTDFMYTPPNKAGSEFAYPIPYLGVYKKNWDKFRKEMLGGKHGWHIFEQRIVAGQKYYDA